jgi:hypothetical protein
MLPRLQVLKHPNEVSRSLCTAIACYARMACIAVTDRCQSLQKRIDITGRLIDQSLLKTPTTTSYIQLHSNLISACFDNGRDRANRGQPTSAKGPDSKAKVVFTYRRDDF